jgi:hypothetical protein
MQIGLGGAINRGNGQWNKCNPDETFMIAASDFVFKCGKNCFTM